MRNMILKRSGWMVLGQLQSK